MFTGIIKAVVKVKRIKKNRSQILFHLELPFSVEKGDSVAINGVCLTVAKNKGQISIFTAVPETVSRTNLSQLHVGDFVNVEPALQLGEKLSGHLVYDHIDDTGEVKNIRKTPGSREFTVGYSDNLDPYLAGKGSIALDGISLTVSNVYNGEFRTNIIPHTYQNTNLKYKKRGDSLNIEVDPVARYIEKIMEEK